ncbi:hypothetical protein BKA65DRAFT_577502 [Rhexocercosporidium sp. MPI-PUGE-AT-0058]|nr:hypothetical protein BKA65DRAFT_577502 [Rhexocercosporidium sp. MPI-PUGE-AT-0058]
MKYSLGPVDDLVYDSLKKALSSNGSKGFCGEHLEKVFESTSDDSVLRVLITQAALSNGGPGKKSPYRKQEKEVLGFAAELLNQIRMAMTYISWDDPIKSKRKNNRDAFVEELMSDGVITP